MNSYLKHIPIKSWEENDQPREKLINQGKNILSDAELIAILLGSGSRNESAVQLAKRIIAHVKGNLVELSKLSVKELCAFKGIGPAKAVSIVAALELGRRRRASEALQKEKISSSVDAYEILQSCIAEKNYEEFWLLLLDRANQIINKTKISEGGMAGTVADPKKIFKYAIDKNASSIILCHNHPSGNIRPSSNDIQITKKITEAGKLIDINVLDHLIIGEEKYFSFADENMM
ncbi:MAG: DNA repair protein RadC [Bacteroidales bacterium]